MSAAKATNVVAFPQRRTYTGLEQQPGLPYRALPFVGVARNRDRFWTVPHIKDDTAAYDVGREFAGHFVQFLKDNPRWSHGGLLEETVLRMDLGNIFDPSIDMRTGFLAHVEYMLLEYAKGRDVFGDVDKEAAKDHAKLAEVSRG